MLLHEAIAHVLQTNGRPMSPSEIAQEVNTLGLYKRRDNNPVPSNQISARINKYLELFRRYPASRWGLADWPDNL